MSRFTDNEFCCPNTHLFPRGRTLARMMVAISSALQEIRFALWPSLEFHNVTNHRWRTYLLLAIDLSAGWVDRMLWRHVIDRLIAHDPNEPSVVAAIVDLALEFVEREGPAPGHFTIVIDDDGIRYEDSRPLDDRL